MSNTDQDGFIQKAAPLGLKENMFANALNTLIQGRLLLYPTETFYAIGGNALNPAVAEAVYQAKGRDSAHPLPVIIGGLEQLPLVAARLSRAARTLIRHFWPGPLTLILPAAPGVPEVITCGTGTVAVRQSAHPAACRLCLDSGFPLISSSANLSGQSPARTPEEISPVLLAAAQNMICTDGPEPEGILPSTIVEPRGTRLIRLARAGAVPAEALTGLGFQFNHKEILPLSR